MGGWVNSFGDRVVVCSVSESLNGKLEVDFWMQNVELTLKTLVN